MLKPPFNWVGSLTCGLALLFAVTAAADVMLPAIFSDHMVLQRDVSNPVWGWADPGEKVAVQIAGQTKTATAGTNGQWIIIDQAQLAEQHIAPG